MEHTRPKITPRDFFLHILAIVTLYASAISFTTLIFKLIELGVPDPLDVNSYARPAQYLMNTIKSSLSILIVMFPVYVGTVMLLDKEYKKDVERKRVWIRQWLIYLTVFIAVIVNLITLISVINHLLDGELTLRFGLKMITVFVVAGSILAYYAKKIKDAKSV